MPKRTHPPEVVVQGGPPLVQLEAACRFLAEAKSVDEVADLRDKAQAMAAYYRQRSYGLEAMNDAAEIKLRAERRLGELLAETVRPGNPQLSNGSTIGRLPEGVSRDNSSRWQRMAQVPAPAFERYVAEVRAAGQELTTAGVLNLHRLLKPAGPAAAEAEQGGRHITLDRWGAMSAAERRREGAAAPSENRFNDQGDSESIGWARWSWNPVTGCEHNCPYCYARDIANRLFKSKFAPSFWPDRLNAPRNTPFPEAKAAEWMGHKNVFVCSMGDLFGRWVPAEWIEAVLAEVRAVPRWTYLFLTKFPIRMAEFDFPENTWVGTTVDCQARVANAEKAFRKIKAGVKWLSCEPLIEPLRFKSLGAFQWVVLGGASRSTQTPEWFPPLRWVVDLEDQAAKAGVPVYRKDNLYRPLHGYPGAPDLEPTQAPPELPYLPTPEGKGE
jgi:protein gp37